MSISVSDRDDVRGRALHHRDVGAVLPQRGADVVGRVVRPDHHAALSPVAVRPRVRRGMVLVAAERVHAREDGRLGMPDMPVASTSCAGPQHHRLAVPLDDDRPLAASPRRSRAGLPRSSGPVVELHDLRVHLEPVADLVLGREHRPVARERQVGQVVVPDRVVQAQRLVAVAPRIARAAALVDDDRRARRAGGAARRARCRPGRRRRSGRTAAPCSPARPPRARAPPARSPGRGSAPCSTPFGRLGPCGSSWPLSSYEVVSSVQHCRRAAAGARGRGRRPSRTSIQASITPPASAGSSPSATPAARLHRAAASRPSIAAIAARPSSVLMFQVNETRSRQ